MISSGWLGCGWADLGELAHYWHTRLKTLEEPVEVDVIQRSRKEKAGVEVGSLSHVER
jgi:hypothetical protein